MIEYEQDVRYGAATVGHAVSHDLRQWVHCGTVLEAAQPGSWDDHAIWTGSVPVRDGLAYLSYTGLCQAERGLVQRIGLAISNDTAAVASSGALMKMPVMEMNKLLGFCPTPGAINVGPSINRGPTTPTRMLYHFLREGL